MSEHVSAPVGKRIVAGLIDFVVAPVVIGIVLGLLFVVLGNAIPESVRSVILILANIIWLIVRDTVFAPGRLIMKLKLVSLTSDKVSLGQAVLRNILLIIPVVLIVGYILELVWVCVKGNRLADSWAKTRVVEA
ncbi:MAG TPA: hypothetical protein DIS66_01365 [Candidatus Omnitrophica bacterium]|nr:hypothetical protein [Candidatus Omnitrophota bacterium]